MSKKTFSDLFPVFSLEDRKLFFQDGRVGIGFRVDCPEWEERSVSEINAFNAQYSAFLRTLPTGAALQTLHFYYPTRDHLERRYNGYFFDKLADFYDEKIEKNYHECYNFLSFAPENEIDRNAANTFYSLGKNITSNPFKGITRTAKNLEDYSLTFKNQLEAGKVHQKRLSDEELESVYYKYFNQEFYPEQTDFTREIHRGGNHALIGEKKLHVITISSQAAQVENAAYNDFGVRVPFISPLLMGLTIPHVLSVTVKKVNDEKVLGKYDTERKIINNLQWLASQENKMYAEEAEEFTEEVRKSNKGVFRINISVIICTNREDLILDYINKTTFAVKKMNATECYVETFDTTNLLFSLAPGNSGQIYRWLTVSGDNAAVYNSYVTYYRNSKKGKELVLDRFLNPVYYNSFEEHIAGKNFIVIGPTGSGKSLTMGYMTLQRFERGAVTIILDVGGTYLSLITALNGTYREYSPSKPLNFNPFIFERESDNTYDISGDNGKDRIIFISLLLSTIWKGTGGIVSPAENALLLRFVENYYYFFNSSQPAPVPTLTGFCEFLKIYFKDLKKTKEFKAVGDNFNLDNFLICMEPFSTGLYRDMLNSSQYENLSDSKLICFDLKRVKENPVLYPVVTMLLMQLALDVLSRYPEIEKYIMLDEAWTMLSGSMEGVIEYMYRTIRKVKGSIGIITQGFNEIEKSSIGNTIIVNTSTKYILSHHEDLNGIDKFSQPLSFNPHEVEKIKGLRRMPGYREIFVKQGEISKVYVIYPNYHLIAILTSEPDERNKLRELQAKHGDIHKAIDEFIKLKQNNLI